MRIRVEAGADHIEGLAHETDPVRAVIELIWNSLDADAHKVEVVLRRNDADGIVGVVVSDDGHGMSPESVESAFHWVGNSWKRTASGTLGEKRPLHGKFGQGRLRAFALGTQVTWSTVAEDTEGVRRRTVIRAAVPERNDFSGPEPLITTDEQGTVFEAEGRDALNRLDAEVTSQRITMTFAPYLMSYPDVGLVYDGTAISPQGNIEGDTPYQVDWQSDGESFSADLRIIEWRVGKGRTLHLCDAQGVPVDELQPTTAPDFSYSAYVRWSKMPEHRNEWMLAGLEHEPSVVGALLSAVRDTLDEHFEGRRAEKRREQIEKWKADETYPYTGEPNSEEEKVERATFDVVATTIRRHIPKTKKQERLTLGLLKDTLQRNPEGIGALLDQFVGLTSDERDQLQRLLERTSLARLIRANTSVTNRLDFLAALRHMVYDPEAHGMVKERAHLHRMLERELWVFGEQFNMMLSERGLTAALRQHLALLGRDPKQATPVRLVDGGLARLDLMLSARAKDFDRIRHLVVELKAPEVVASDTESNQIKKYARAVAADPQFADVNAHWDFMLIVNDYDDDVKKDINQQGRSRGILDETAIDSSAPVNCRVWVKKWSEVMDEAERRLEFYQRGLEHDPTLDDIREYLTAHHADVLPEGLFKNPQPDGEVQDPEEAPGARQGRSKATVPPRGGKWLAVPPSLAPQRHRPRTTILGWLRRRWQGQSLPAIPSCQAQPQALQRPIERTSGQGSTDRPRPEAIPWQRPACNQRSMAKVRRRSEPGQDRPIGRQTCRVRRAGLPRRPRHVDARGQDLVGRRLAAAWQASRT